jgi:hypothetical protein
LISSFIRSITEANIILISNFFLKFFRARVFQWQSRSFKEILFLLRTPFQVVSISQISQNISDNNTTNNDIVESKSGFNNPKTSKSDRMLQASQLKQDSETKAVREVGSLNSWQN